MSLGRNAGSALWGLALVALGAILLARNIGYDIPLWSGIAIYWPVLLILWGGVKTFDYIQRRRRGESGRLFSPGEVFLLIVVVMAGTAVSATARLSPGLETLFDIANIELWPLTGNEYDYTEHYESDAVAGSDIEIVNRYGSVEVTPDDVDRITVDVRKTIITDTQADADQLAERLTFSIVEESTGYRVLPSFNRDDNRTRGRRVRTSLNVRVPAEANVTIDNRNGRVTLNDLRGDQQVDNAFGEVDIRRIDGSLRLDTRNGEVTVENITESAVIENAFGSTSVRTVGTDLELDSRNGEVIVDNVTGSAVINNAFARTTVRDIGGNLELDSRNGRVEVSDVTGDVEIENSFAPVEVVNVEGELTIRGRNNDVDVENIGGDVDVESAFQDIEIRDARGELRVVNRNGDVNVRLIEIPTADIFVSTEFSSVTLSIPSDSTAGLDLSTRFGEIESDFGGSTSRDGPTRSLVTSSDGGGPTVRVRTRNGNIRISEN
jgi:hypothetical protein